MNNNPPNNNKNGTPLGSGKLGPSTRSHDAQVTTKCEALTHLKSMTILGDNKEHESAQGLATALKRYLGSIRPTATDSISPLDIRKTMLALALLIEALPNTKESTTNQLNEITMTAIEEAKEELKKTVQEEMGKIQEITKANNSKMNKNITHWQQPPTHLSQKPMYSSIAAGALSADARLVAQKAIQNRQILLKIQGTEGAIRHEMDIQETKRAIQGEIDKLDGSRKIWLIQKTREKGVLLEMAS